MGTAFSGAAEPDFASELKDMLDELKNDRVSVISDDQVGFSA